MRNRLYYEKGILKSIKYLLICYYQSDSTAQIQSHINKYKSTNYSYTIGSIVESIKIPKQCNVDALSI